MTPVFTLAIELIRLKMSLVKIILYMPTMSFLKLLLVVKDGFVGFYFVIKEILTSLTIIKRIIIPAAKTTIENKETTMSLIQFC